MKTQIEFADRYVSGRSDLFIFLLSHLMHSYSQYPSESIPKLKNVIKKAVSELIKKYKLDCVSGLKLKPHTEALIYVALWEFTNAILLSKNTDLKKMNAEFVKKRKSAMKHLSKALEYKGFKRDFLEVARRELQRLRSYDVRQLEYNAEKEIEFMTILGGRLQGKLLLLPQTRGIPHNRNLQEKLLSFLSSPLMKKMGRPRIFFFKALQIVIFKLLEDKEGISVEGRKEIAATILNEWKEIQGIGDLPALTRRDIDNALHST